MTDGYLLLTPLLMLPIVALLGFVGCAGIVGIEDWNPDTETGGDGDQLPGPTNLVAVAGDGVVDLSWDDYLNATEYHLKRGNTSGQYDDMFPVGAQSPTYADTLVVNDKTYYYVVSAIVSGGETKDSEETPPATPMATTEDFVTSFTVTAPQNTFNGWAGMEFTVASQSLDIQALGRVHAAGDVHQHTIKIIEKATLTDLASVTLDTMGGTDGQMQSAKLSNPVTLSPNTTCYLVSQETSTDSLYMDDSTIQTTGVATVANAISGDGVTFLNGIPGYHSFGPLTFQYSVTP